MAVGHTVERIPVTRLRNGHRVELVVHRLTGSSEGPQLTMLGGVHGDEPIGSEIVRGIVQAVDCDRLTGTVVAIPVANPYGYHALSRFTPLDGANPSTPIQNQVEGSLTQQVVSALRTVIADGTDYYIDFHSGGSQACVDYVFLDGPEGKMARAFGSPVVYEQPGEGVAKLSLPGIDVPTMISELGGGLHRPVYYRDRGVEGALNVMRALGMLPGEVKPPLKEQTLVRAQATLRPKVGGTLESRVSPDQLGEAFAKDTVLGRIVDPYTFEETELLLAPYDPTIMLLSRCDLTTVDPGDFGFMVADGATAEPF